MKYINYLVEILMISIVLLIVFQPDIPLVTFINENAIWLIILFIVIGFIYMVYNQSRLVYFSMISAGVLTFFLQNISNQKLVFNKNVAKENALHILHMDIFNTEDSKEQILKNIIKKDADILMFEELSPDWNKYLIEKLKEKYKNIVSLNSLNFDSKLIMSKYNFVSKDTFKLAGHPQLDITVFYNNIPIKLIYTYVVPYTMVGENINNKYQIDDLAEYIGKSKISALIVAGEFNQVYWTKRIRNFLYKTKLNNSRRFISFQKRNPYDHIFYSDRLNCLFLDDIYDSNSNHIGIEGYFRPEFY